MKLTLRLIGLLGVVVLGTALGLTFGVPEGVESVAASFVRHRIEMEVGEKIEALSATTPDRGVGRIAKRLAQGREAEIATIKERLRSKAYEKVAEAIAEMRDLSCECREKYAQRARQSMALRVSSLELVNSTLLDFAKTKYMVVVSKLTRELRIFLGSNLAVFASLLLLSFAKPRAVAHLFLPALLLTLSTLVSGYFYVFRQNWFFTLVYSDYVGWAYVVYVMLLFGALSDIAFNRARITTATINTALHLVGSAVTVAPC